MTDIDIGKRRFLGASIGVLGAIGITGCADPGTAVVAIQYMGKSERALQAGAPIDVDISKLLPGMLVTVQWRSQPIIILRRSKPVLDKLQRSAHITNLQDPNSTTKQQPIYTQNATRSIKPGLLVVNRLCTHLGCSSRYDTKAGKKDLYGLNQGGFFCACHGARFDLAGRVYKGGPATDNLHVPPHYFVNDSVLRIGQHSAS